MDRIVVVAGPTASGKTALSVALARRLGGEVISADSMQVYRHMDIGTAKVTPREMAGIPHHMLDVAQPDESFSAARFVEMADPILQDILRRGKVAVVAGGTGLYVDALIQGRRFAPGPGTGRRQALERQADALGMEEMLARLRQVDPESAARLHPADRKRVLRALEVYEETGMTITEHDRMTRAIPPKYAPVWLGLTFSRREILYARIDRRVEDMVAGGLLEEIRGLLAAGVPRDATAMQAIGYKEFLPVLEDGAPLEQAVAQVQQGSRRYAKRQLTWFRRNPRIHWIVQDDPPDMDKTLAQALRQIPFFDGAV